MALNYEQTPKNQESIELDDESGFKENDDMQFGSISSGVKLSGMKRKSEPQSILLPCEKKRKIEENIFACYICND